jgi:hypothetical protein
MGAKDQFRQSVNGLPSRADVSGRAKSNGRFFSLRMSKPDAG